MTIFDGYALAAAHEANLITQVAALRARGVQLGIGAVLFSEDQGSVLYTNLKAEAAARVGISYQVAEFSLVTDPAAAISQIQAWNQDSNITGIIVQKPWRKTWVTARSLPEDDESAISAARAAYESWWSALVSQVAVAKDVDGLHPETLAAITANTWRETGRVLPATCRAVLEIMAQAYQQVWQSEQADYSYLAGQRVGIVGISDLVGRPLAAELRNNRVDVSLISRFEMNRLLESGQALLDFEVVVTATGQARWLSPLWLKPGAVLIDVGEPRPDVDISQLAPDHLRFLSPVPGGVGPMTVVSLLENCVELVGEG